MRTIIAMLTVIIYAAGYGSYVYIAKNNLYSDYYGTINGTKEALNLFFMLSIGILSLTCQSVFERAWLQTGLLFAGLVGLWKVLYSYNILHAPSINTIIGLCFATGIISLIFFRYAVKYNFHKTDSDA